MANTNIDQQIAKMQANFARLKAKAVQAKQCAFEMIQDKALPHIVGNVYREFNDMWKGNIEIRKGDFKSKIEERFYDPHAIYSAQELGEIISHCHAESFVCRLREELGDYYDVDRGYSITCENKDSRNVITIRVKQFGDIEISRKFYL